jgi:hypothetical protein
VSRSNSSQSLAASIASWRNGSAGFFKFLDCVEPRVSSGSGGYVPYVPSPNVGAEIARVLATPGVSAAVFCWPRQFGKTATSVMVLLWRFLSRSAENIAVVANSEKQVTSTAFRRPSPTIWTTPHSYLATEWTSITPMSPLARK